jgi:glycosyltransferase involved in cell wall biosynthesis
LTGLRLSVAIIARDEADRLPACLASVRALADEIVVLDTGSSDDTVAIAEAAGARVARHDFVGFGPTKQIAAALTSGAWILSIDADERLSPALAAAVRAVLDDPAAADGYELNRRMILLGRMLRFGGLHDEWVVKLFRRGRGRFTTAAVHEHVEVDGRTGRLAGVLEHHTVRSLGEYVAKVEWYAAMRAEELAVRGVRWRLWDPLRLPLNVALIGGLRLGVLDGVPGILYAWVTAYSSWLKRDLLRRGPEARAALLARR